MGFPSWGCPKAALCLVLCRWCGCRQVLYNRSAGAAAAGHAQDSWHHCVYRNSSPQHQRHDCTQVWPEPADSGLHFAKPLLSMTMLPRHTPRRCKACSTAPGSICMRQVLSSAAADQESCARVVVAAQSCFPSLVQACTAFTRKPQPFDCCTAILADI